MFRFALDATSRDEVKLGEEIAFIRSYLEIEQARFGERLRYRIEAPPDLLDCPVPPMLIQPLVENSVRHGISPRSQGGSIVVRTALHGGLLSVTVEDDGVGFLPGQREGVGLPNVRARVLRLSGADHFHVESKPGAGTVVSLELPLREYADPHR
jgi:sensor histidine kinase YesM